jgi:hypothetical protein
MVFFVETILRYGCEYTPRSFNVFKATKLSAVVMTQKNTGSELDYSRHSPLNNWEMPYADITAVSPSVTYYHRLHGLSDFHEIWYSRCLQNVQQAWVA